jgi:hypothetical protein
MPQAEALNLLAITLMLGMSSPPSSPTAAQAVTAQQRPHLEAAQVGDHIELEQGQLRTLPVEPASIQAPAPAATSAPVPVSDAASPAGH